MYQLSNDLEDTLYESSLLSPAKSFVRQCSSASSSFLLAPLPRPTKTLSQFASGRSHLATSQIETRNSKKKRNEKAKEKEERQLI